MHEQLARALRRLASNGAAGTGVQVWAGPPGARVPYGDLAGIAAGDGAPDDLGTLTCGTALLLAAEAELSASVDDGEREVALYAGPGPASLVVDRTWPEVGVLIVRSGGGDATFTFHRG